MTEPLLTGRRAWWLPLLALAAVVYPALLLTEPGVVVADTKSYLYLDPGRLLERALSMWDPHVGLGTVPHQQIGFLWPIGPYYWLMEAIGAPDWVAQRLWIGSIIVAAGGGVLFLGRTWRWRVEAAAAAAFVYALSPFVLTLAARLSIILLPFAGLPWLLALTIRSLRTPGWRHPAIFALVVATVGSVNATALLLVGIVPVGWILYSFWASDDVTRPRAVSTLGKIGVLTVAVNLWWIGGLSVQATNGIDVLRYTETAEVVADSSTAPEVLRGLGYWFFYGGDRLGPWIESSVDYTQHLWLIALTYAIPTVGLVGLGIGRWRHRVFLVGLLAVGTIVAVGAHPWDDPSPVGRVIKAFLGADVGLAMRSLPRAVPLVALATALGIGTLVAALSQDRPRQGPIAAAVVALAAVVAIPPLWTGGFVPDNLQRPEEIPGYWRDAARYLDDRDDGTRVLEIPGIDFASYRWGNTVDPITPGLIDRPYAARELVPFGSPPSADLLNALDRKIQEQTLDPESLAPLARLLGAGDVVTRNDLQYERYNTPRPRTLWELVRSAPGLGTPTAFGPRTPNVPTAEAPLIDEQHLARDGDLPDPPAVAAFPVEGSVPIVRTRPADTAVILSGDGAGIVDAAAAGLLDGTELVRYSASLTDDPDFVRAELRDQRALIVTDTNRKRATRWTTIRHTQGFTEEDDGGLLRNDVRDNRLPIFEDRPGIRTVAEHGPVSARATGYGNPITYLAEDRPVQAVDGDRTTAWRTAAFEDARGERIELAAESAIETDEVVLLQPTAGPVNRWITEVELRFDRGERIRVALDERSRGGDGQRIPVGERTFEELSVEIVADTAGDRPGYSGLTSVGFAEIGIAGRVADERLRMPQDLLDAGGFRTLRYPLALVQTRERAVATDITRFDEELSMSRVVDLPTTRAYRLTGSARLAPEAPTTVLDALVGRRGPDIPVVTATSTLPGGLAHLPANALDGDAGTSWTSAFEPGAERLEIGAPAPIELDRLSITFVDDDEHSVPATIRVIVDGAPVTTADLSGAAPDGAGRRTATVPFGRTVIASRVAIEFAEITPRTTIDWNTERPERLPISIADLTAGSLRTPPPVDAIDTGCRDDLVTIDDAAVPVQVSGPTSAALAGGALTLRTCDGSAVSLAGGDRRFDTAAGRQTGLDLDQLVWCSAGGGPACGTERPFAAPSTDPVPPAIEVSGDDATLAVTVTGADPGTPFWLVLGQSHNPGWEVQDGDVEASAPQLVDGYANGFLITPAAESFELTLRFMPQNRVEIGLLLSAAAAILALGLAVAPRRSAGPVPIPLQEPIRRIRALSWEGALPTRRDAVIVGVTSAVGATIAINPLLGAVVGVLAGFATRREGWRPLFTVLPAGLLGVCGLYVVAVQFRNEFVPGLAWPQDTGRLHTIGLAAVVLLVVDVVVDHVWARRSEFR